MPTATTVHIGDAGWGLISVVTILVAIVVGFPTLLRGGGYLRGGRRARRRGGRDRVRVGPGLPATLALAMLRRADTVALTVVTAAVVVLVVLNARA